MSFLATTSGVSCEDVHDLMLAAVEHRFGLVNRKRSSDRTTLTP
jgi:putative transposase